MNISINHKTSQNRKVLIILFVIILSIQLKAQTDTIQTTVPALKNVYANDFYIGCLLSYRNIGLSTDPAVPGQSAVITPEGGNLIKYHMNSMSPGNNMKTAYTVDLVSSAATYAAATDSVKKDSIEIHPVVRFNGDMIAQLNWVKRRGFTFRGHTLVWHSSAPTAFFRSGYTDSGNRLTKDVMVNRMDNYIHEVIRLIHESWPGLLSAIDVVNEAISDNGGAFRTIGNEWYTTFGDQSYVMKAFEFARKYTILYGETQIKLYYNDYNTDNASKANAIVSLCTPIFSAGYLDGIGMQEHNSLTSPTTQAWIDSYNKFDPICTEMAITELDVNTNSGTNTPSAAVLTSQANQYAALFKCFVARSYKSGRGKIINVTKDGLNDQYTFVTNQSTSLWDIHNQCKPSFYSVVSVGSNYNSLVKLISKADSLNENDYPKDAWTNFTAFLNAANNIIAKNYSSTESAATDMSTANYNLQVALDDLANGITPPVNIANRVYDNRAYATVNQGIIYVNKIQSGANVYIYSFSGILLKIFPNSSTSISMPYSVPCIINIHSKNENNVLKVVM